MQALSRYTLCVPLRLILGKDLPLGVVADSLNVDEASDVELLRSEHGHLGGGGGEEVVLVVDDDSSQRATCCFLGAVNFGVVQYVICKWVL